jgi:hypothetical protein
MRQVRLTEAEMCRIWNVMQVEQNGLWLYRFLLRLITTTKFGVQWEVRYWREVGESTEGWERLFEFVPSDDGDADEEEKGSTSDDVI